MDEHQEARRRPFTSSPTQMVTLRSSAVDDDAPPGVGGSGVAHTPSRTTRDGAEERATTRDDTEPNANLRMPEWPRLPRMTTVDPNSSKFVEYCLMSVRVSML